MEQAKIESAMQHWDEPVIAALLTRLILRGLPLLAIADGEKPGLTCWPPQDRARHLQSVFEACQIGVMRSLGDQSSDARSTARGLLEATKGAALATADATSDTTTEKPEMTTAAEAAAAIVHAAAILIQMLDAECSQSCVEQSWRVDGGPFEPVEETLKALNLTLENARQVIGGTMRANPAIQAEMMRDFTALESPVIKEGSFYQRKEALDAFFQLPLWACTPPSKTGPAFDAFKATAMAQNAGFATWLDWLEPCHRGAGWKMPLQPAKKMASGKMFGDN